MSAPGIFSITSLRSQNPHFSAAVEQIKMPSKIDSGATSPLRAIEIKDFFQSKIQVFSDRNSGEMNDQYFRDLKTYLENEYFNEYQREMDSDHEKTLLLELFILNPQNRKFFRTSESDVRDRMLQYAEWRVQQEDCYKSTPDTRLYRRVMSWVQENKFKDVDQYYEENCLIKPYMDKQFQVTSHSDLIRSKMMQNIDSETVESAALVGVLTQLHRQGFSSMVDPWAILTMAGYLGYSLLVTNENSFGIIYPGETDLLRFREELRDNTTWLTNFFEPETGDKTNQKLSNLILQIDSIRIPEQRNRIRETLIAASIEMLRYARSIVDLQATYHELFLTRFDKVAREAADNDTDSTIESIDVNSRFVLYDKRHLECFQEELDKMSEEVYRVSKKKGFTQQVYEYVMGTDVLAEQDTESPSFHITEHMINHAFDVMITKNIREIQLCTYSFREEDEKHFKEILMVYSSLKRGDGGQKLLSRAQLQKLVAFAIPAFLKNGLEKIVIYPDVEPYKSVIDKDTIRKIFDAEFDYFLKGTLDLYDLHHQFEVNIQRMSSEQQVNAALPKFLVQVIENGQTIAVHVRKVLALAKKYPVYLSAIMAFCLAVVVVVRHKIITFSWRYQKQDDDRSSDLARQIQLLTDIAARQHSVAMIQDVMEHNMQTEWTGLKRFGIADIHRSDVELRFNDEVWISITNDSADIYHVNIQFKYLGPISKIPPLAPKQLIGELSTKLKSDFELHNVNNIFAWDYSAGILTWTLYIKDPSQSLAQRIRDGDTVVSSLFDLD